MIKFFIYLEIVARKLLFLSKGKLLKLYLVLHGCQVGKNLKCKKWPIFRCLPTGNMMFGNYVTIGYNITFDPVDSGRIILGDHVHLTQNILISSRDEVRIGAYALIAENVSIRDADHQTDLDFRIAFQDSISKCIKIGEDVWIGAGSIILKGAVLRKGSVIGAHSIITRHNTIEQYHTYAGSPLRLISIRKKIRNTEKQP